MSEELLSDKLKRELSVLASVAKPAEEMSASEIHSLYKSAGGEVYTYEQIRDGLSQKLTWVPTLADQLAKGFRFIAGVWRPPTDEDIKQMSDQMAIHSRQVSDLQATINDMDRRLARAKALPRMMELKTLIADAEAQERIAESLAAGERQRLADEKKAEDDAAALARFRASEAKQSGGTVGDGPTVTGKTEILSAEVTGERQTVPAGFGLADKQDASFGGVAGGGMGFPGSAPPPPAAAEPAERDSSRGEGSKGV